MEEKLFTKQDLEQYGQQIRQEMLNEFYTAVWQAPFRTPAAKVTAYKIVDKIAKGYNFPIEEKITERFVEEAQSFKECLESIHNQIGYAINSLNEHYHLEDKNGK
jgi:uncharacterized protein (DUF4213/DUF364 family)